MMVGNHSKKSDAFRDILRIVGRGRKLQRDLTTDEAREAMRLMLSDRVSDAQIGAFLVTMRVKEETADEITTSIKKPLNKARAVKKTGQDRMKNMDGLVKE